MTDIVLLPGVQTLLYSIITQQNEDSYGFLIGEIKISNNKEINDNKTKINEHSKLFIKSIKVISDKYTILFDDIIKVIKENTNNDNKILGIFTTYALSSNDLSLRDKDLFIKLSENIKNENFLFASISYENIITPTPIVSFNTKLYKLKNKIFESKHFSIINIGNTINKKEKNSNDIYLKSKDKIDILNRKSKEINSSLKTILYEEAEKMKKLDKNKLIISLKSKLLMQKNKSIMLMNELLKYEK